MSELESLATEEGLDQHLRRHALDRLIMLSDGVFAIAVTLAAVEIRIPSDAPSLSAVFAQTNVPLFTYAISFLVIAVFWLSNRDLFARIHHVDKAMTALTLAMLCIVALIPASTHIVQTQSNGELSGSLRFYSLTMVISGCLNCAMWIYASFSAGVMIEAVPRSFRWHRIISAATVPLLFLFVLLIPTTQMFKWIAPFAIVVVLIRRAALPRLLKARAG
jgi:uncharacterized membrane protein